jgi:hypothetical protein
VQSPDGNYDDDGGTGAWGWLLCDERAKRRRRKAGELHTG